METVPQTAGSVEFPLLFTLDGWLRCGAARSSFCHGRQYRICRAARFTGKHHGRDLTFRGLSWLPGIQTSRSVRCGRPSTPHTALPPRLAELGLGVESG